MSTPAGKAMADAAGTAGTPPSPGGAAGTPPGAAVGTPPGAGAANQPFFSAWDKPEQKEIRDWAANKNYPDTFTLARTARDLEREAATLRQGKGYPGPKLDPKTQQPVLDPKTNQPVIDEQARTAWRTLTGVPETPDKYELPDIPNNPYPNFRQYMAEEMLAADVPAAMAPRLAAGYERALQRLEAENRAQEDQQSTLALRELEREWGSNYQERMALADRGMKWLAQQAGVQGDFPETQRRLLEGMMGTGNFLTAMWKIGAGNTEARSHGNDGGNPRGGFEGGAAQAQARVNEIMAMRASNQISDRDWNETFSKEVQQLGEIIAKGMAPPPGLN
ncbi:MAG TPA: hypothetical protein VMU47_06615 [Caldimonas sp.]|nr:hypothetical protein [Caldimonas sp.]